MGYSSNWDHSTSKSYAHHELLRSDRAVSAYTADVLAGRAARIVHKDMNPMGVRRESRDSTQHPTSLAIGVMFDHTGSMGAIPRELQRRLTHLMSLLSTHHYVDHPQVMFGAIGDATCDAGPLQVGQFEAGIDVDKDLERVWVEGGGGGGHKESYELAHYFFARHVVTDCWEKRSKKGYLFTVGDEAPYPALSKAQVAHLIGDNLQADIPVTEVMAEVQNKWHVFHLLMETTTSKNDHAIGTTWKTLLPEGHVIDLRNPNNVGEVVGLVVGINEGNVANPEDDLAQLGIDGDSILAVLGAIAPLAKSRGIRLRATA